ncbi:MAG: GH92 family glycosyl hydrolase [Bacteroidaceae bacterium]
MKKHTPLRPAWLACQCLAWLALSLPLSAIENPVDYVNPLVGSLSTYELSTGNTYPAIAMPWGMNSWTPQTGPMGDGWTYTYTADKIRGFKQTHQPSPWMNDYGQFSLMPATGALVFDQDARASWFSHKAEDARPYYYKVYLADADVTTEIVPTERAALFRLTFPEETHSYVIADAFDHGSYVRIVPDEQKIVGYSTRNSGGVPPGFKNYFVMEFDKPFSFYATVLDGAIRPGQNATEGNHAGGIVGFATRRGEQVHVRVASSFVSPEQAELNLRELDGDFEQLMRRGRDRWNQVLGRIDIASGPTDDLRTFYSCLYRSLLFPRMLHETDAQGHTIHYSPYNGRVEQGPLFGDTGFWDTFRSLFPLVNLLYPEMAQPMQEGWANAYRESGFLPEWSSPGHRDCMIGQHSASVVADAYRKGIPMPFADELWEALHHGAHHHLEGTASGRVASEAYDRLGYVPRNIGVGQSAARTLEYAYNDWCIYTLGKALGKADEVLQPYRQRALNYRHVFHPASCLMAGRDDQGVFDPAFCATDWSEDFCEGNSWHWSFCVFHDPQGLSTLMGGDRVLCRMLDSVFVVPGRLGLQSRYIIHEMREMQVMDMGQYAHGNQPIQHMAYLYNYAGEPWKCQYHVRRILRNLYQATPDGYCGDEDNGQTSAWYVFSALGFYPVCPGTDQYVLGSPLFADVRLHLPNGRTLRIRADQNTAENCYVDQLTRNGKRHEANYLTHTDLLRGGELRFRMSPEPNRSRGTREADKPYSFSTATE